LNAQNGTKTKNAFPSAVILRAPERGLPFSNMMRLRSCCRQGDVLRNRLWLFGYKYWTGTRQTIVAI